VVVFTSGLHGKNVIIDERIVHYELLEAIVVGLRKFTESIVPIARRPASTQFKPDDVSGPRQGGRTVLRELVPSVARHFRWLTSATYSNGSINR
jgi:hypothetical protein